LRHVISTQYSDFLPAAPTYTPPPEVTHRSAEIPTGTIDLCQALERIEGGQAAAPTSAEPQDEREEHLAVHISMDDTALLAYTSGTTGRPTGAMLTYRNAVFKAKQGARASGLTRDDIHLAIPPLYHISGMLCGINIPIYLGGTIILHYRFNARSTVESIERHRPTYWKGIAPMLPAIMDDPECQGFDLSSLRKCPATSFGIRTTPELAERWLAFSGNGRVYEAGYGLTETHTF